MGQGARRRLDRAGHVFCRRGGQDTSKGKDEGSTMKNANTIALELREGGRRVFTFLLAVVLCVTMLVPAAALAGAGSAYAADSDSDIMLTVNYYDANSTLISSKDYSSDEVTSMYTQQYATRYCNANGLGLFACEGVTITDLLEDNGITADPASLNYVMQTASQAGTSDGTSYLGNFLFADRYYYAVYTDNETTYDELGGMTVADYLCNGATDADSSYITSSNGLVDGFITRSAYLRQLAAESISWTGDYAAVATEPILAYSEVETSCTQYGKFYSPGDNPTTMYAPSFDDMTVTSSYFQLRYGMGVETEDGVLMANDETTRNYQASSIAVVNVYNPNYVVLSDESTGVTATLDTTGSEQDSAYTDYDTARDNSSEASASKGWTLGTDLDVSSDSLSAAISGDGATYVSGVALLLTRYGVTTSDDNDGYTTNSEETVVVTGDVGSLTVSVPVDAAYDGQTLVAYCEAADGTITTSSATVADGYATFTVSTAGTVMLAVPKATAAKKAQNLKVKAKKASKVKYSKLKKKAQSVKASKLYKITGAKTTKSFAKVSVKKNGKKASKKVAKKIVVKKKTGKITLKKGLAKGTYKVKVKVSCKKTSTYKAASKKVTVTIKVK